MGITINNNYISNVMTRHYKGVSRELGTRIERMSSGLRINRAADDASGLAISEKFRAQASGITSAMENIQNGISMVQTAEGSLGKVAVILRRMEDLVRYSANGDKTDSDRKHYQEEINSLSDELSRIENTTEYNTKKLLDGSLGTKAVSTGDIDNIVNEVTYKGGKTIDGEYQVDIIETGSKAKAMITGDAGVAIDGDTTMFEFAGSVEGDYTFRIDMDGLQASATFSSKSGSGDTIGEAVEKISASMKEAGMDGYVVFNSDVDDGAQTLGAIEIVAGRFGSAHDIQVSLVNQPSDGSFAVNPAAVEGSTFNIYNSDLSDENGLISDSTVVQSSANSSDINSLDLLSGFENATGAVVMNNAISVTDKLGNTISIDLDTSGGDSVTIKNIVDALNSNVNGSAHGGLTVNLAGGGADITAVYDATNSRIIVQDNSSDEITDTFKVTGELSDRLGISGEVIDGSTAEIKGQRISGTKDYIVSMTDPDRNSVRVMGNYGTRDNSFNNEMDNSRGMLKSGVILDGKQTSGGVYGLEIRLNEETFRSGSKFSVLISSDDESIYSHPSGELMKFDVPPIGPESFGITDMDITTQDNAFKILENKVFEKAREKVSVVQTRLGSFVTAMQNELQRIGVEYNNTVASESRIRDTDIAKESMNFTRDSIIQQSAVKVLSTERIEVTLFRSLLQAL